MNNRSGSRKTKNIFTTKEQKWKYCRPICQSQRRMNPNLREILKEELQKLLNAGFIYPISDSEWVFPLVIVPKKTGNEEYVWIIEP